MDLLLPVYAELLVGGITLARHVVSAFASPQDGPERANPSVVPTQQSQRVDPQLLQHVIEVTTRLFGRLLEETESRHIINELQRQRVCDAVQLGPAGAFEQKPTVLRTQ